MLALMMGLTFGTTSPSTIHTSSRTLMESAELAVSAEIHSPRLNSANRKMRLTPVMRRMAGRISAEKTGITPEK